MHDYHLVAPDPAVDTQRHRIEVPESNEVYSIELQFSHYPKQVMAHRGEVAQNPLASPHATDFGWREAMRGVGPLLMKTWQLRNPLAFYNQSFGRLHKGFPDSQELTSLGNVTQLFVSVNDNRTADYVSARLGEETIILNSGGSRQGTSLQFSQDRSLP